MKKFMGIVPKLSVCLATLFIISCGSKGNKPTKPSEIKEVFNEGKAIVENGKGKTDTINYKCVGCKENLSFDMFELVKKESTRLAMENLKNPLSFKPLSMDLLVTKEDSLYSFDTGKKIDSVISVFTTYKYIGQNAYGTEISGDQIVSLTLVNGIVKDISEDIKLKNLSFDGEYINRSLTISKGDDFIDLTPTKDKGFIVKSSVSCVDEGSWLLIYLTNGEKIKLISWNDFNCDGTLYFNWFTKSQIEMLKSNQVTSISVVDEKSTSVSIPKNNSDYFQQLMNLF